ncbi:MAG: SGNH hydrolase domain-containing protein, partial [Pseudomonadota bacterium]
HARALAGALDLWLAGRGEAAHFTFAHSCVPVRGVGQPRCVGYAEAMMTAATASDQIEDVILVSAWRQLFEGGIAVDGRWRAGDAVHEPFAEALLRDAEKLAAGGKRMIIVDPLFASPRHAPKTAARNIAFGRDWSIDQPLAAHQETFAPLFAAFDRATAASDARRVSLLGPFCDGGLCRGLWRGRPVFTDNNHLAFGLSGIVASEIARQMSD